MCHGIDQSLLGLLKTDFQKYSKSAKLFSLLQCYYSFPAIFSWQPNNCFPQRALLHQQSYSLYMNLHKLIFPFSKGIWGKNDLLLMTYMDIYRFPMSKMGIDNVSSNISLAYYTTKILSMLVPLDKMLLQYFDLYQHFSSLPLLFPSADISFRHCQC